MITSKQRSYLRGLANTVQPIFQLGKNGLAENFIKQIDEALEARELIKVSALKNTLEDTREAAHEIAREISADVVQVVGSKFVLYRESKEKKKIILPK